MKRRDNDLKMIKALKRRLKYRLRRRLKKRVRHFPRFQLTTPTFIILTFLKKYLTKLSIFFYMPANECPQSHKYEMTPHDTLDLDPFPEPDFWVPFYPSPISEESNIRLITPPFRSTDKKPLSETNVQNLSLYLWPKLLSPESPINRGIFFFLEEDDTLATILSTQFREKPFHKYRNRVFRAVFSEFFNELYTGYMVGMELQDSSFLEETYKFYFQMQMNPFFRDSEFHGELSGFYENVFSLPFDRKTIIAILDQRFITMFPRYFIISFKTYAQLMRYSFFDTFEFKLTQFRLNLKRIKVIKKYFRKYFIQIKVKKLLLYFLNLINYFFFIIKTKKNASYHKFLDILKKLKR